MSESDREGGNSSAGDEELDTQVQTRKRRHKDPKREVKRVRKQIEEGAEPRPGNRIQHARIDPAVKDSKTPSVRTASPPPSLPASPVFKREPDATRRMVTVHVIPITGDPFDLPELSMNVHFRSVREQIYLLTGVVAEKQLLVYQGRAMIMADDLRTLRSMTKTASLTIRMGMTVKTGYSVMQAEEELVDEFLFWEGLSDGESTSGCPVEELSEMTQQLCITEQSGEKKDEIVANGPVFCALCKIRCKLASRFSCRTCHRYFCTNHRHPESHECISEGK